MRFTTTENLHLIYDELIFNFICTQRFNAQSYCINLSQIGGGYELAPILITSQPTNQVRYWLFDASDTVLSNKVQKHVY